VSEGGISAELPKGWVRVRLDEIAEIQGGIQKQQKRRPVDNKFPFLRVANVASGSLDLREVHEIELFEGEFERFALRLGDLLVVEGNGSISQLGRAARWKGEIDNCVHQNHLIRVRPGSAISAEFLELLWNSPVVSEQLRGVAASTSGLHTLSTAKLKRVAIPLPPLEEQRRIVATLEQRVSWLASGSIALRSAQAKASALRRKIIADLTMPLSCGWSEYQLGELAISVRNGMYVSRPGIKPDGVAILRIGAVRPLQLNLSDLRYSGFEEQQVRSEGYLLTPGDLLFTRYNGNPAYVGACAVVPRGAGALTYPDKLIRMQLHRNTAEPEFVAMACAVGPTRHAIQSAVKTTAGQAGISGKDLKKIRIWLPSLDEQRDRVRTYRHWQATISRLEAEIAIGESRSERLRRSLLAEAFTGHLVPQNPADEPADALLARIRAEREAVGQTTPQRRNPRRAPAQRTPPPLDTAAPDTLPPPPTETPALASATQPTLDLEFPA
jgi:type I restriction enzyme S subunit